MFPARRKAFCESWVYFTQILSTWGFHDTSSAPLQGKARDIPYLEYCTLPEVPRHLSKPYELKQIVANTLWKVIQISRSSFSLQSEPSNPADDPKHTIANCSSKEIETKTEIQTEELSVEEIQGKGQNPHAFYNALQDSSPIIRATI